MQDVFEKGRGTLVAGEPIAVQDEVVNLIGEDELVNGYTACAEGVGESRCLLVGDVRVVIAVDEQDGRLPALDGGHGRAGVSYSGDALLLGERAAKPVGGGVILARPLVHTVEVDAGSEEIAVARERECGEVAAVASAPDADA